MPDPQSQQRKERLRKAFRKAVIGDKPWYVMALRTSCLVAATYIGLNLGASYLLPGRALTEGETKALTPVFKGAVDYSEVKIHSSGAAAFLANPMAGISGKEVLAHTRGNVMIPGPSYVVADYSKTSDALLREVFLHEQVHIWQHQNCPVKMFVAVLKEGFQFKSPEETYNYTLKPGKDLLDYSIEQQATIITDYYQKIQGAAAPLHANNNQQGAELKELYRQTLKNFEANPRYLSQNCHKL